jgi:hypothetical protein
MGYYDIAGELQMVEKSNISEAHKRTMRTNIIRLNIHEHTPAKELAVLINNEFELLDKDINNKADEAWVIFSLNTLLLFVFRRPLTFVIPQSERTGLITRIQNLRHFCFRFINHNKLYNIVDGQPMARNKDMFNLFFRLSPQPDVDLSFKENQAKINKLLLFTVLMSNNGRVGGNSKLKLLSINEFRFLFMFL